MASNIPAIMNKIARQAQVRGLTVNSNTGTAVNIENGSNDLTITYVTPSILAPMGGVDNTVSPFLGIGTVNPGSLKMKSSISTNSNITDVIDGVVAATVQKILDGFSNDLILENANASFSVTIRGDADLLGMGQ
jgi:hypothetical protein